VAIKIARPEVASRDDLKRRFLREAAAAARLDHPGIVPVHDAVEIDQHLFYIMPYCEGEDLAHWLGKTRAPVEQRVAAELIRQVAEATHYGHTQGIIHRDLKPANILLVPTVASTDVSGGYQARILDFGLSRSMEMELQDTRSSLIVGTPLYMSPEQATCGRRDVGAPTDIFALGSILYEILTGEPPFAADSLPEVIERLATCDPVSPRRRRPDVDPHLEQICLKCLRRYPEDRYASAQELADDLGRFLRGELIRARRATWFDKLRWWGRRPRRVAECGIAIFVGNFTLAVSMLLLSVGPIVDPDDSMTAMRISDLLRSLIPGAAAGFFVSWIGIRIARGSRGALWLGTAAVALQWMICAAILFFGAPPLLMYQGNPLAKWIVHAFLLVLFSLELLMCLTAIYAGRAASGPAVGGGHGGRSSTPFGAAS
jgi:serine/threonine-protein kinase